MKYRSFLKRIFKQLIEDSFFRNLIVNECTPENFEDLRQILTGDSPEDNSELKAVLNEIRERMAEYETAAETEEQMDTIHKIFQEAIAEAEF